MMTRYKLSTAVERELKVRNLTADEVLRKALNIKVEGFTTPDGKYFPEGTIFVAIYKDKALSAFVRNGVIDVEGKSYSSLSAAAAHYTGRATTNGWDFWFVRFPGKSEFIQAKAVPELKAA
jgi:hypothetical protein